MVDQEQGVIVENSVENLLVPITESFWNRGDYGVDYGSRNRPGINGLVFFSGRFRAIWELASQKTRNRPSGKAFSDYGIVFDSKTRNRPSGGRFRDSGPFSPLRGEVRVGTNAGRDLPDRG